MSKDAANLLYAVLLAGVIIGFILMGIYNQKGMMIGACAGMFFGWMFQWIENREQPDPKKLKQMKKLRLEIDAYQMEIISMNYPNGDTDLEKAIKKVLIAKLNAALLEYKKITDQL